MADGYSRISGKVGVIIAHVMGGSYQLSGQLFNAQVAGTPLLVIAGRLGLRAPGLPRARAVSGAEPGRVDAADHQGGARAYTVVSNPAAIPIATMRALREATTPPTGPVYLSISAELLNREGLEAQIGEGARYRIERPGPRAPRPSRRSRGSSARPRARP